MYFLKFKYICQNIFPLKNTKSINYYKESSAK